MSFREKTVLFGTIAGGFNLEVDDDGTDTEITLATVECEGYPTRWRLEGNVRVTDEEMAVLKGLLESFSRVFDKKISEAIGSFISKKRSQP